MLHFNLLCAIPVAFTFSVSLQYLMLLLPLKFLYIFFLHPHIWRKKKVMLRGENHLQVYLVWHIEIYLHDAVHPFVSTEACLFPGCVFILLILIPAHIYAT